MTFHIGTYNLPRLVFLLTCLLRGMTANGRIYLDNAKFLLTCLLRGMTKDYSAIEHTFYVSTHMPLARHDFVGVEKSIPIFGFYSHASCEA